MAKSQSQFEPEVRVPIPDKLADDQLDWSSIDAYGHKAIKGTIDDCVIEVYIDGQVKRAQTYDPKGYPYQLNNMQQWFLNAIVQLKMPQLTSVLRRIGKSGLFVIHRDVNFGEGVRQGKGANDNVLRFHATLKELGIGPDDIPGIRIDFKIQIRIKTTPHQYKYAKSQYQRKKQQLMETKVAAEAKQEPYEVNGGMVWDPEKKLYFMKPKNDGQSGQGQS